MHCMLLWIAGHTNRAFFSYVSMKLAAHYKKCKEESVKNWILIPFMPPTLKIPVNTRLLESQTEVGEPTNYNTSFQALPVLSLGLQQPSSHWIISNRVVSSINIFLSILSVWFSLDHIALCSWLELWLCLGPHHEWNPTLRQESRVGRLINSHPIYLSFQQIICHCVFTCTHVDDSLKEKKFTANIYIYQYSTSEL